MQLSVSIRDNLAFILRSYESWKMHAKKIPTSAVLCLAYELGMYYYNYM